MSLSASTFKVAIRIYGSTYVFLLVVPYLAIDPLFPHHLNSFDNVPLNYNLGSLVTVLLIQNNFSLESSSAVYHTETINYTQQSAANVFKTFQTPLSSNKIVLFLSTLYLQSGGTVASPVPLEMDINYTVLNTTHYQWSVRLFRNATIARLHFGQIVYN